MYFWDSRQLAADLREGAVPARTLRNYLMALLVIGAPTVFLAFGSGSPPDAWDGAYVIAQVILIIIGVLRAYQANGGDQGSRFVEKSVALMLPLTMQSLVLGITVVGLLLAFEAPLAAHLSVRGKALSNEISSLLVGLSLQAWVLWRLIVHLPDTIRAR